MAAVLDFRDVGLLVRGALEHGKLKLVPECIAFKSAKSGQVQQFNTSDIKSLGWMRVAKGYELKVFLQNGKIVKFDGFKEADHHTIVDFAKRHYGKDVPETEISLKGWNWGDVQFEDSLMSFKVDGRTAFEIPLQEVSQVTSGKNEVTLEFHQGDSTPVSLLEMRFYVPPSTGEEGPDPVQAFHDKVKSHADVMVATGDAIATFEELQVLTPRGRYDFTAYPTFIQLHGKTYDYKIPYEMVSRQFLLPYLEQRKMYFVLAVDPPLKQGQTRYPLVIMQFSIDEECSLTLPMDEEEIKEKYGDKLQSEMQGSLHEVFSKVMRAVVGKKVTVPGSYKGPSNQAAVHCSHRATAGLLYPLDKGFLFIHKPAVYVRLEDIAQVNFARMAGASGASRSFDLEIELRTGTSLIFSSIIKDDYSHLYDFISTKNIRVKNKGKTQFGSADVESSAQHDAYLERMKAEAEDRDSEDEDSDFVAAESSDDDLEYDSTAQIDSDDDNASGGEQTASRKRKAPKPSQPAKKMKQQQESKGKRKAAKKDPAAPKRPLSAFMLWMQDTREQIKRDNPGASVPDIGRIGGEMWRALSDKSEWEERAGELKKKYEKDMKEYKESGGAGSSGVGGAAESTTKSKPKAAAKPRPAKKKTESPMKYKSVEYIEDSDEELEDEDAADTKKKTTVSSTARSSRRRQGDDSELVALPEKGEDDDDDDEEEEEESTGDEGNDSDDMDDD